MVFTDGSSKIAYQRLIGGYRVWCGQADARNRSFVLFSDEEQMNNWGNLGPRIMLCHASLRVEPCIW